MKKLTGLSIIAISLFAASQTQIGVGFGRNNVSNSPMKDYNFLNLRIGKTFTNNHAIRLELEKSTSIKIPGIDEQTSMTRLLANVQKNFTLNNKNITPYVFLGGGYQWIKGIYDNAAVADAGMGVKFDISRRFDMFVEGRGLRDFHNNDNHYGLLGGFEYKFLHEKPKPVVIDSDNDGVPDNLDKCPNTPAGVKVDKNGCPIDSDHDGVPDYLDKCPNTPVGIAVDDKGCPVDEDHDGVPYYLDKCPNTPAGVKVDKNGCPIDSDHDGVPDYLDKCPNTPKGITVDKNGCPVSFNFEIEFDPNKAVIKPQYMEKIEEFAKFLKDNPAYKAEIQGYTDNTGKKIYNILLSQKRAKAVYQALIKLGVPADRLTWTGYGPANPIAPNDTKVGRAKNRRVVAKLYF